MPVGFQSRSYEPEDNSSARTEPQTLSRDSWLLYCSAFSLHIMETGELLNTLFPSAWVKPLNNYIRFLKQKHKKTPSGSKWVYLAKTREQSVTITCSLVCTGACLSCFDITYVNVTHWFWTQRYWFGRHHVGFLKVTVSEWEVAL